MRNGARGRYVWYTARHRLARNCPPPYSLALVFRRAQTRASETTSPVVTNTKYAGEKCSAPLAAPAPFSRVAGLARTNHCPTQQTSRALFLREPQYFPGGAGGPLSRVFPCPFYLTRRFIPPNGLLYASSSLVQPRRRSKAK